MQRDTLIEQKLIYLFKIKGAKPVYPVGQSFL